MLHGNTVKGSNAAGSECRLLILNAKQKIIERLAGAWHGAVPSMALALTLAF